MKRIAAVAFLALATVASPVALSDDVAAQRARLAEDRIRAEEEQRIRAAEEQRIRAEEERRIRAEAGQAEDVPVEPARRETPARPAESETPAAGRIEMSRALEQLRELGALKDAGHLTDEEFRLLKQKILDEAL